MTMASWRMMTGMNESAGVCCFPTTNLLGNLLRPCVQVHVNVAPDSNLPHPPIVSVGLFGRLLSFCGDSGHSRFVQQTMQWSLQ
jgi:hypothetical protein